MARGLHKLLTRGQDRHSNGLALTLGTGWWKARFIGLPVLHVQRPFAPAIKWAKKNELAAPDLEST